MIGKCCHSFMQITAPILHFGKLTGYLVASPFSLFDPSELQPEELSFLDGKGQERIALRRAISKVPVMKDGEANKAAKMLFHLADQLSTPDLGCLLKVREIQALQGKIADQISDLKSFYRDFNASSLTKFSYEQEKKIISKIRLGDREGAKEILYRLLATFLSQHLENFELLRISVLELLIVLTRTTVEAGTKIEEILGMKYDSSQNQQASRTRRTVIWVVQLFDN